jgi:hypothetical protein
MVVVDPLAFVVHELVITSIGVAEENGRTNIDSFARFGWANFGYLDILAAATFYPQLGKLPTFSSA